MNKIKFKLKRFVCKFNFHKWIYINEDYRKCLFCKKEQTLEPDYYSGCYWKNKT